MSRGTDSIIKLTKDISGISLNESKRSLIYNRLNRRLKELNMDLSEYSDLCQHNAREKQHFLDLITTNHTSFMREGAHFEDINERIIPISLKKGKPRLRVWSAACSSGQEPYTLLIRILEKYPESKNWDIRILATDISQDILRKAKDGLYTHDALKGLSKHHITIGFNEENGCYRIKKELRDKVSFAHLNLIENWRMSGPFDVIFCRNVMIYFDEDTRARLINRFASMLGPQGTLYIGHTESLHSITHPLRMLSPSVYENS